MYGLTRGRNEYDDSTYLPSGQITDMDTDHVLVVFLGLVLVGAAVALAYGSPAILGDGTGGVGTADLRSFETTAPQCGAPNGTAGSAFSSEVDDGEVLVLNESVPVTANDTRLTASLEEFGPGRYVLAVTRERNRTGATPTGDGTATDRSTEAGTEAPNGSTASPRAEDDGECRLTVRYTARVHLPRPDEYTVLVTHDGELVGGHWRDGGDDGSFDRMPERTPTPRAGNQTETENASLAPQTG